MPVCSESGCPVIIPNSGRCANHKRQRERERGTRQQRGYNTEHDRLRRQWTPRVAKGTVNCSRCGNRITPGTPWDLGHTDDRTAWTGPEHMHCNRSAAGRASHR